MTDQEWNQLTESEYKAIFRPLALTWAKPEQVEIDLEQMWQTHLIDILEDQKQEELGMQSV